MKPQRSARLRAALVAAPITALALVLAACGGAAVAEDPAPSPEPAATEAPAADAPAPGGAEAGGETTGPIVVEHQQGTVELDGVPQTVFSFDWGVTQVLQALDVPVHGLPTRSLVPPPFADLAAGAGMLDVGTLHEPDFELVAANRPDLIIVAARSATQYEELSRIAPTVDLSVDTADNITESKAQALLLGEIFGRQAEAQALVDHLAASIEDVKETIAATQDDALVILSTGGAITAFGPGGRFGLIYDELGFPAAAAIEHDGRHGQAISFEFLLETDPAWLFVVDRDSAIQNDGEAAQAVLDNDIVRRTQAYQNDRIVYVDTTQWYLAGTGVVSLQRVIDDLAAVLAAGHAR